LRRILIVVVLALVATGCPKEEDEPPTNGGSTGASETTQVSGGTTDASTVADPAGFGCPAGQGVQLSLTQPYASLVTACVDQDRTSIHLKNASTVVLRVWPVSGAMSAPTWEAPDEEKQERSLAGEASVLAVNQYAGQLPRGHLLMPPGWSFVATLAPQTSLDLRVEWQPSVTVLAAKATANWVEGKVKSKARQLAGNVAQCAKAAGELYAAGRAQSLDGALQVVFFSSSPCISVKKQVDELLRPPAGTADDAARIADDLARNARRLSAPARAALGLRNALRLL
jgi:hypothetical protein